MPEQKRITRQLLPLVDRISAMVQRSSGRRLHQTAGLALLLLISDLSNGCSDHLPLLVLAGSTELRRNRGVSQSRTGKHITFIFPLNTILVSSSISWTDCSFFARMSNFSADSDLKMTAKWWQWWQQSGDFIININLVMDHSYYFHWIFTFHLFWGIKPGIGFLYRYYNTNIIYFDCSNASVLTSFTLFIRHKNKEQWKWQSGSHYLNTTEQAASWSPSVTVTRRERQFQDYKTFLDEQKPIRGNTSAEKEILLMTWQKCLMFPFCCLHRQFHNHHRFPAIVYIKGRHDPEDENTLLTQSTVDTWYSWI